MLDIGYALSNRFPDPPQTDYRRADVRAVPCGLRPQAANTRAAPGCCAPAPRERCCSLREQPTRLAAQGG
ncbi:hypothetical protein [Streptomyces sp. E1N211]|uniref:hypothetical protein n=1 Tax=Streptomyces sp. E1N211 TaxID=1851876 RepID=UPI0018C22500|nr:hypothetical protein [Streptomyces sp. E1N211]